VLTAPQVQVPLVVTTAGRDRDDVLDTVEPLLPVVDPVLREHRFSTDPTYPLVANGDRRRAEER